MAKSLINRKATKEFILREIKDRRRGWECTCVGKESLDKFEYKLRQLIIGEIDRHPTKGKTFKI